jgi:hypothetical protein
MQKQSPSIVALQKHPNGSGPQRGGGSGMPQAIGGHGAPHAGDGVPAAAAGAVMSTGALQATPAATTPCLSICRRETPSFVSPTFPPPSPLLSVIVFLGARGGKAILRVQYDLSELSLDRQHAVGFDPRAASAAIRVTSRLGPCLSTKSTGAVWREMLATG